ncbi:uncharacterized protein LOC121239568 [Juglans microcarpa x Juglans regia]|uniref:uncharacterized protein LOC121239568 n=1 Tax=Juglans microcarpa x Juglans regia TaxID=2249226 RepID=UPI001B7ECBE7|nr:uncharacterized protein LOC121239568 [Juglans microcarpa x Juglans regia]
MTKYGKRDSRATVSQITSNQEAMASNNDSNLMPITGHKLNGNNYLQWSHSVMMFICGKGKDDYLTGDAAKSNKTDEMFKVWNAENNMVMSWLINSMTNDIGENFLLYGTAKEIWDAAKEIYSNNENTSELFEVESVLHDFRQGELIVTQYFKTLNRYWQQLDLFEEHNWSCPNDGIRYRQIIERKIIYKLYSQHFALKMCMRPFEPSQEKEVYCAFFLSYLYTQEKNFPSEGYLEN